jgi:hypothetical protein
LASWLRIQFGNLQGLQKRNFIKAFKDILRTDDSVDTARVLFVSGWDGMPPGGSGVMPAYSVADGRILVFAI